MNRIYVSTSCLKNPKKIIPVLEEYEKAEIENVELGSVHEHFDVNLLKKFNFNFLIHNYFPPPKKSFVFNLASQKKSIRLKSRKLALKAIDLCCEINSPLYTFHAGFTVEPSKLGIRLSRTNIFDREKAVETYANELTEISTYAKSRGIKIAMEPNVVQKFNLIDGKNELCLFAENFEINKLFKIIKKNFVGILLDLGHTSVTSHWLQFDRDDFVKKIKLKVFLIHLSNNNGLNDQHKSLTPDCWQVTKLKMFKHVPIVLETMNLTSKKIKYNIQLVKELIDN